MVHVAEMIARETPPCPTLFFQPTDDMQLVRDIITVPHIYRSVTDDGAPPPELFKPSDNPAITYLLVFGADRLMGLFAFFPENTVTWQVHTCLLQHAAGWAVEMAIKAVDWIWKNTDCKRIITRVPQYNRLALRLAKQAGLSEFGIDENSFLKGGKLHDQVLLGVSHPEVR